MPRARVRNQLRCERCGSLEFTEAEFRQYERGPYSATPGNDLWRIQEDPLRALICLCGNPIPRGRLRSGGQRDRESFQESLEAARRYRDTALPQRLLSEFGERYPDKQQYDSLAERIANLERMLQS